MIYKIEYENLTFSGKVNEYLESEEAYDKTDLEGYIFMNIHRYNGNHAMGHGCYKADIDVFEDYPQEYLEELKNTYERELVKLKEKISKVKSKLMELDNTIPAENPIDTFTISSGGVSPKEEVLKDYCDGNEELFEEQYGKYYDN